MSLTHVCDETGLGLELGAADGALYAFQTHMQNGMLAQSLLRCELRTADLTCMRPKAVVDISDVRGQMVLAAVALQAFIALKRLQPFVGGLLMAH